MKTRHGHVSNSSSSSFVVKFIHPWDSWLYGLLVTKMDTLGEDRWDIEHAEEGGIRCSVSMDNFNLYKYLTEELKIPTECITYTW
jgi:hypothetical protein